jgi:hypothetical protein
MRPVPAPISRISPPVWIRDLGCGHKIPAAAELGAAGAVIAESRRIQRELHEALERQPAARLEELRADELAEPLAVCLLDGRKRRQD